MIDRDYHKAKKLLADLGFDTRKTLQQGLKVKKKEAYRIIAKLHKNGLLPPTFDISKYNRRKSRLSPWNKYLVGISLASACFTIAGLHVTGYARFIANVYPIVKLGQHTTTLNCDYSGKKLSVDVQLYRNIDNYYRYKEEKKTFLDNGDLSRFVYSHSGDQTLTTLAADIKKVGINNNLRDDQLVELATCFVQNIPYDKVRAEDAIKNGNVANFRAEHFPYETLYNNTGICTDKTYLASAILKELGYGTGILVLPDAQHVALGISVPGSYGNFGSQYAYMEVTNTGYVPGLVPPDIDDNNGVPAVSINKVSDLTLKDNPSSVNLSLSSGKTIPKLVIDVNQGNTYNRIVPIKNLESKILTDIGQATVRKNTLQLAYNELSRRKSISDSAFSYYQALPSTSLDCGYKYNYTYSYSYTYPYTYTSPYTYRCDTVSNPQKNYAYSSYSVSITNYNNQVSLYNKLLSDYNSALSTLRTDLNNYEQYVYN